MVEMLNMRDNVLKPTIQVEVFVDAISAGPSVVANTVQYMHNNITSNTLHRIGTNSNE